MQNEKVTSRFKQEVAITLELSHDNIVRVYDIGEAEGTTYFTMEWIDGISMRDYIQERKKKDSRLSVEEVTNLMRQLCSALSYAHNYSGGPIIHRDIKPENLLMVDAYSKTPKIKITDFGIAKIESAALHATTSTYMGTPIYMAPEQYTEAHNVDKRADVYSVGVIFYELLTFMHPLGTFQMPSEINHSLPGKFDDIIKRSLSPDRTKRYDDTMDIIKAIEAPEAAEAKAFIAAPVAAVDIPKKKSMLVPALVGAAVVIGCIAAYALMTGGSKPSVASPAPVTSAPAPVAAPKAPLAPMAPMASAQVAPPEPEQRPQPVAKRSQVRVSNAVVARSVGRNSEPVGAGTNFKAADVANGGLSFYMKFTGAVPGTTVFKVLWYRDDNLITTASDFSPSSPDGNFWNTLDSNLTPGNYHVRLIADGQDVAKSAFIIQASAVAAAERSSAPVQERQAPAMHDRGNSHAPAGFRPSFGRR